MSEGVTRTVNIALCTYIAVDGESRFGLMDDEVQVHPDHVDQFDRVNRAPGADVDVDRANEGGVVDVNEPVVPRRGRPRKNTE